MSTRNIVPVNDAEGGIGTAAKRWLLGWINTLVVNAIKIVTGAGAGKFLKSDADGNASWSTLASGDIPANASNTSGTSGNISLSDVSNTRKFLRELSVGGVFQTPAWDTLLAADIPDISATYQAKLTNPVTGTGTQYYLTVWGASGVGALAGLGTAGQVLISAGAGVIPAWGLSTGIVLSQSVQSSSGTLTINWASGRTAYTTLTENITGMTFSNPVEGQIYHLVIVQHASAAKTVAWTGPTLKWNGGSAPTQTATVGHVDVITFLYAGGVYYASTTQNFS